MQKLKNSQLILSPFWNHGALICLMLNKHVIIIVLHSLLKNIQFFGGFKGYFFSIAVLTVNHSHTNK